MRRPPPSQVINCRPKSSGAVRISSADPAVAPTIRCNYLAEPCDALALAQGIALARRLATSGALGEISLGEVYPGAHVQSAAEVETYIRRTLHSANGLSGGCCIGAVVDSVVGWALDLRRLFARPASTSACLSV